MVNKLASTHCINVKFITVVCCTKCMHIITQSGLTANLSLYFFLVTSKLFPQGRELYKKQT